jgi:hypothetical protein
MLKEIYIRDESDPFYDPNMIDYTNEVENVISQIRMILGTKPGEMLGDYNFGVDLEYIIFNTRKSAEELADKIREQINVYVHHSSKISVDVDVNFGDSGRGYDYGIIDILINGSKAIGFLVDKNL